MNIIQMLRLTDKKIILNYQNVTLLHVKIKY
jgi:hypothetical protein